MRILYLAPETTIYLNMSGGAGTHMRGTVDYLKRNNEVITIIGGDEFNKSTDEIKPKSGIEHKSRLHGLKQVIKPFIPSSFRRLKNDLRRLRDNERIFDIADKILTESVLPDVIYERSGYGFDTGLRLSKKYEIPLVLESDVTILDLVRPSSTFFFNRFLFKKREALKTKMARSIVVMSEPSIKLMKEIWNINHERVFFKGLGINKSKELSEVNIDVRKKYNLENKFLIGYVGIFQDYQNIPIIFEVAENLKHRDDIAFIIIGTGSRLEEYKNEVKSRGLNNVIFTGIIDKDSIQNYYEAIDLGLITDNASHMYPVKFLEFIKYKKITLTPSYKAFESFYENKSIGEKFMFQQRDSNDLKNKILAVIDNKKEYEKHLQYTYDKVINEFTWEQCSKRLENILRKSQ